MQIKVEVSQQELKAVETCIVDLERWIHDAVRSKIRACLERIVAEHTNYNPARLDPDQLLELVIPLNLPSRREKDEKEQRDRSSNVI